MSTYSKPLYLKAWERLPERFRKDNNKSLYYVLYGGADELMAAYGDIEDSHNIDKAFGTTLDKLGANVGEFRENDMDDELYRLLIKVRIIANMSIGDIPTINYVMSTLLGDQYIDIKEGFLDDLYLYHEPASMRMRIGNDAKILPYRIMDRLKAAGIRILIDQIYGSTVRLNTRTGDSSYLVWLCGEHPCGDIPYPYIVGQAEEIMLKARTGNFDSKNYYGYAGTEYKSGELRDSSITEVRYVQKYDRDTDVFEFGG